MSDRKYYARAREIQRKRPGETHRQYTERMERELLELDAQAEDWPLEPGDTAYAMKSVMDKCQAEKLFEAYRHNQRIRASGGHPVKLWDPPAWMQREAREVADYLGIPKPKLLMFREARPFEAPDAESPGECWGFCNRWRGYCHPRPAHPAGSLRRGFLLLVFAFLAASMVNNEG